MNMLNSKKGQGNVLIAITLILFCTAIIYIIAYLVLSSFMSQMATTSVWDASMALASSKFLGAIALLDYIMVLFTIVLILGIGITSYRLASPAIFMLINLITGCFYGFIAYFFSYIFQQFVGNSFFTATLAVFPRTVLLCSNLHWIALAGLVVGSITLYAKKPQGQYLP